MFKTNIKSPTQSKGLGNPMRMDAAKVARMVYSYRYVSLLLTSVVYLLGNDDPPFLFKAAIVIAVFLLTVWITNRYRVPVKTSRAFITTIALEMAGMALLIVLTGGAESPFLWCMLNPALVSATYLSAPASWSMLAGSLLFVVTVSYFRLIAQMESHKVLLSNSIPFLQLVLLMMLALQVFASLKKESGDANVCPDATMEHIKSLYQIVDTATQVESENMGKMFADFALKLTKMDMAFFWDLTRREGRAQLIVEGTGDDGTKNALGSVLEKSLNKLRVQDDVTLLDLADRGLFLVAPVKSTARFMGVLGVKIERSSGAEGRQWPARQILFLSELYAVIAERHHLTQIENQLMIIEEQNRIADEMHDSVSQNLFGIVYAVHSLSRQWKNMPEERLMEQLELIRESSNAVAQELRSTIYSLSSRKNDGSSWVATVKSHLERLSKLHGIEIRFEIEEDAHRITVNYQKALYRMISEAVGNAIRHGLSDRIEVVIRMEDEHVLLAITDNGKGFQTGQLKSHPKVTGLGIGNIQFLVKSLGGMLEISSSKGKGTRIFVRLPIRREENRGQEEAAVTL